MTQHDPARARPAWGATSVCTRCGNPITWKGQWVADSQLPRICLDKGTWGHHRSATAGTVECTNCGSWGPPVEAEGK